ncbi:MAG: Na/Pi cotransporter family protein [Clostridia bacterium]|nr:Na/Pi cotransporter family protein [Clostridia bacterium]
MDVLALITGLCGGLGLFLYGMHIMASGLQKAAGSKLKKVLEMLTKNRVIGILVGALVTAVIQSSSATTVMVVGFVNAGLMNLTQAVGIIMGANIGTTITGWIVSSAEFLKTDTLAPIAVFIGAAMILFCKKTKMKQIGEIIIGFGVLFIGIEMMSSGVKPLAELEGFKVAFQQFGKNPVLGVFVGMIVTAIIQSSSASVGILLALSFNGLVTWDAAVYIIMGQNIGTCATALLSGLGASKNAKGASYIHLLFNVIGSAIFSIIAFIFFTLNPGFGNQVITPYWISVVHTGFNIANTVIMFPFANGLVKLAEIMCRSSKGRVDEDSEVLHLDDRLLNSPSIAIASCIKEIVHLGNMASKNLMLACDTVISKNTSSIEKIYEREEKIDNLTKAITQFLVKLCNKDITTEENDYITSLFHTVHDIERIGDHCENLAEFTETLINDDIDFSDSAKEELREMFTETEKCVRNAVIALEDNDIDFAEKVIKEEERVDGLEKSLRQKHIDRLTANLCSPLVGVVYLDILTNLERVSDLALNVAQVVIKNKMSK